MNKGNCKVNVKLTSASDVKEKEYTIPLNNLSDTFKDLKIVQFSDILYNNLIL